MNLNKLRRLFPHSTNDFLKLNSDVVDSIPATEPKRVGQKRVTTENANQEGSSLRLVISLVSFRRFALDYDGVVSSFKHIQDAIASTIGLDDGDKRITWQYQQIQTRGEEGVLVRIELK